VITFGVMQSAKRIYLTLFVFMAMPSLKAQQYFYKNYSVESGLPFIQAACLFQDQNGYLWSGGYGGLSRFDGKHFVNYGRKNGLPDVNVNTILGDEEGRMVVGTNKGICVLEGDSFISPADKQLQNRVVLSLGKGFHHSVYVGTDLGLYLYHENKVKLVKKLSNYRINAIYKSDTTALYLGTDQGLIIYGHGTFEMLNEANGLASNKINCISHFKHFIVIGTNKGLSFFNPLTKKFRNYFIDQGLIDENIRSLLNQKDQFLWVGSQTGLLRFDNQQFAYYNVELSNNSNNIQSVLLDQEDNIWLGTYSGLYRYRDNSFSTFDKVNGPGNSFVFQILRDKSGNLWVGTQNNGVYKYDGVYFKNYSERNGLKDNSSRAIAETQDGHLLFGNDDGLLVLKNEKFMPVSLPEKFLGPVDVIYKGKGNIYWLGGSNGFVKMEWLNGATKSKFFGIPSKKEFVVYGFCEDSKNNVYIGTYHSGLFLLKEDSLIHLNSRYKFEEDNFFTLRCIRDKVFAATLNGLVIYDTQSHELKRVTSDDGLNSDLIYSIEFAENQQSLWIGTNQGINKMNVKKFLNEGLIEIQKFGKEEGFAGVECNTNGIWEDKDGTLWFGTVGGLIRHEPFQFKKNTRKSPVLIQKIQVMNSDSNLAQKSKLPYGYNTLSFHYRTICLTNPDKVLYKKKLTGFEKEWSEPAKEDYSKYLNLPPGEYTFSVKACNNEGVWNEEATHFEFKISRPFYRTWWFMALVSFFIISLTYLLVMIRIYKLKRTQKKEFERKVEMSKIELKALRSQMNPHFVFNSLNSIQHYIVNSKSEEAIKYLSKFARLIRMILNYSDKPTVTVGEDLESLKLYIELEKMRFEDKFDYDIEVDASVELDYDIMPPMLMQPYVENAILHGLNPKPEKGLLNIRLRSENNFLICTITDNGIGREKSTAIKLGSPGKNHRSLGMKITEERLKILNEINASRLSVVITDNKTPEGKADGTKVELFIPLTS
jgi:ligand-binding sensor domain-containing protein